MKIGSDTQKTPQNDPLGMRLVAKPKNVRDLGNVDVSKLVALVGRISDRMWVSENQGKENKFPALGETQHIIFRFTPRNRDPRLVYSNPIWDIWKAKLLPVIETSMMTFGHLQPAFSKVMLARMRPGGVIHPHIDGTGSNLTSHKVHVPLVTNPDARFFVEDVGMNMVVGRAYEVNNVKKHSVENKGSTDRVHLIFETYDAALSPKLAE